MTARRAVRIANCSGFYGDRITAAREMVEGGPIDVLTGDYLAELTMLILWKARQSDSRAGYARTFLVQMEEVLGTCLDRGIRIVSNAGGLNPAGLAERLGELALRLGLEPTIAYVEGDDLAGQVGALIEAGHPLRHLDTGEPLADTGVKPVTANAYLGGWGIAEALEAGADVVVCPRVTDASLVVGPAAWWHGWRRDDYDALAGAVVAGHVIECGPQATGGNYSWLSEVTDRRYPGFPIAQVEADGASVITKHPGTGGLVSPGTVTAQLLYEIAEPAYINPDVVAHFGTLSLRQAGPSRVRISGTRGSPPPPDLKVALNYLGGYRNTMTLVLTGLDIEEKAAWAERELFDILGGRDSFAEADTRLLRFDRDDAPTNEQATAHLRITVKDPDPRKVGRRFSDATMQLALGGYAGFHTTTPPGAESAYGVYWPALVPAAVVEHVVVLPDGTRRVIPHPGVTADSGAEPAPAAAGKAGPAAAGNARPAMAGKAGPAAAGKAGPAAAGNAGQAVAGNAGRAAAGNAGRAAAEGSAGPTRRVPLGRVCAARSGDKGGNANIGVWTRDAAGFAWLRDYLTTEKLRELIPEAAGLAVRRYELPNLRALNFVVIGLLGQGVASSTRPDPQAKGLGEYLRSRHADVPTALLEPQQAGPEGERMDFSVSPEHQALREAVGAIAAGFGGGYFARKAEAREPTTELWQALAERGYIGINIAEEHGGGGAGLAELAIVCEESAAQGCPLLLLLVSSAISGEVIAGFGTPAQRKEWLPRLASGAGKVVFAITEPDAGSNMHRISTTAARDGDGYLLRGQKHYISGVDEADAILVVARTGTDNAGGAALSLFIVDTGAPGLVARPLPVSVSLPERQFTLYFDDVKVGADRLVGTEGDGFGQVFHGLNPERITGAAVCVGVGRYALAQAAGYACGRVVWDQPIGAHQGVAHPLAQAKIEVELAALMTARAAWLHDHGQQAGEAANMAKYAAAEAALAAVDAAIQVHGGNGLAEEYGLIPLWGLARLLRIAPVNREMILNYVAQHSLGLPRSY